jgi:predicted transcriptional regulator of viral defense system
MAQILACQPAVASHWTAAWLWGLTRSNTSIHLTATSRRHKRSEFRVHYANLTPADVRVAETIPLTSPARTLLDPVSLVTPRRLAKLLQRAEELKHFDLRDCESLLAQTHGHPGHASTRPASQAGGRQSALA